mgnify:FL=1|tara:strand:- start:313 stop:498 length:186 start_codon:yes stop_codon:yes gene_type:complete
MEKLRKRVETALKNKKKSWYWLSTESNINSKIIYRFRDGEGLSGKNTIKIMQTLQININEL